MNTIKRIAVLTSGGDAPGMNAAIRAVVRRGLSEGLEVIGIRDGFLGLHQERFINLTHQDVEDIINKGGTILGTARFVAFEEASVREEAVANLKNHNIDALIIIGGNGSFTGALRLSEIGIPCIGIPATIDNDVKGTDFSIGFDTALNTVVECMDKLREEYRQKENSNTLNTGQKQEGQEILKILRQYQVECAREKDKEAQFQIVRKLFNEQVLKHDEQMQMSRRSSKNAFAFIRTNWGMGQEMYLFMTELIENEIFKEFLEIWGQ